MPKKTKVNTAETTTDAGWTCPDCGLLVAAEFAECACGTTYDGPMEVLPPVATTAQAVATPYAPDTITEQYRRAISGTLEILRFGAMLIEVDMSLTRETHKGGCFQTGETLKAWLEEHCPEVNYKTAMRFKSLAQGMQQYCQVPAKLPLSLALPREDGGVHLDDLPDVVNKDRVAKIQQQVWDMVQGTSARQLMFEFKTFAAPRGGDHGGGAASHERAKTRHTIELEMAIDEWNELILRFRDFTLVRKRANLVPAPLLEEGVKSINDGIRHIQQNLRKG